MSTISGYVEKIWANPMKGKNGKPDWTSYAVVVDGTKYGTYTTNPKCKEGDFITFEASQSGEYWNAEGKTIKLASPPAGAPKPAATQSYGGKPSNVQAAINYQSARKDAGLFLDLALKADALDLGTKKGGRIDILEAMFDQYTMRFFSDTSNLGHKPTEDSSTTSSSEEDTLEDDLPY